MTPMLRQYFDLKERCPDAVLFFRMGDFYEIFGNDALEVAPLLNIVLARREKSENGATVFCGVPHHSARTYWLKLLKLNYKIAIADQVEDAAQAKGLVKRDITKYLTPACIDDLEGLQSDKPNHLMFVHEDADSKLWVAGLADVSTGELRVGDVGTLDDLAREIETHKPKEVLVRRFLIPILKAKLSNYLNQEPLLFTPMPEAILRDEAAQKALLRRILANDSIPFALKSPETAVAAVSAVLTHLSDLKFSLEPFLSIFPLHESERSPLGSIATNDLEIFSTTRMRQQKGSLFHEVNYCLSPMGARLLRWSLVNPLLNKEKIRESHEWVAKLVNLGEQKLEDYRSILKGIVDIERLFVKVLSRTIKARELAAIRDSLLKITSLHEKLSSEPTLPRESEQQSCIAHLNQAREFLRLLNEALKVDVGNLGNGDEIFTHTYDIDLDDKNELSKNGEKKVEDYQEALKTKTGIPSLKIKTHKTFGLLIEVTKSHLNKIPEQFIRQQTMVNCERFITVELQELSNSLITAKEDALARELFLFEKLLQNLSAYTSEIKNVSAGLAKCDMLLSFAWLALQRNFCRPDLSSDQTLELLSVRHPTVESFVGAHNFVPNDIVLHGPKKHMLITGPNMGGKSTTMRTVAICAILNQCGSFVPAKSAKLPIFDQIFTRVGASDDLVKGLSTFMVEMTETAVILRLATERSLVILDEVGRGTSTEDGLAIATAVLQSLVAKAKSWTFFATHYHELVQFAQNLEYVCIFQTEVLKKNDEIKFSHRLVEGASGSSYGIEVAKLAGIPDSVILQAREFLARSKGHEPAHHKASEDKDLAVNHHKIIDSLERISINRTTPLQALNIIHKLKEMLDGRAERSLFPDGQSLF